MRMFRLLLTCCLLAAYITGGVSQVEPEEPGDVEGPNDTVGPKCIDPPFNDPNSLIPNACCHPRWVSEIRRPNTMPHCLTDSSGLRHYGVTMRQIEQEFGVMTRSGQRVNSSAWAYGPDCRETFEHMLSKCSATGDFSDIQLNSAAAIAAVPHSVPGPTFQEISNQPLYVLWKNELPKRHLFQEAIDEIRFDTHCGLFAPNCRPDVRSVVHFHGGHTLPQYDGFPHAWFTQDTPIDLGKVDQVRGVRVINGSAGQDFMSRNYYYQIDQEAGTFWYHDHVMGVTAQNAYAGLAGLFFIRDQRERGLQLAGVLPSGRYEMPLVLKDYWFRPQSGQLWYNLFNEHEFFGNYSAVNGQVWPFMRVEPTRYRFRFLNACNSRFLRLSFRLDLPNGEEDRFDGDCDGSADPRKEQQQRDRERVNVTMVFSDGGLLRQAAAINSWWMTPAERYDLVIDFSPYAGRNITLHNDGPVELGLPWRCPRNCAPTFGTGPDRWVRFVVGHNVTRREHAHGHKHGDDQEKYGHKHEVHHRDDEHEYDNGGGEEEGGSGYGSGGAPASSPSSGSSPYHGRNFSNPQCRSRQHDRRSWFDRPTNSRSSPFPPTFRGPIHTGAPDKIRQIILLEVDHDLAFDALHTHPGTPVIINGGQQPTIVTQDDNGELFNNNNIRGVTPDRHEIYMMTVNDPRFETGIFFDDLVTSAEACTTERWELINISNDTHAIHLHIIEYELIGRANFSFFRFGEDPVIKVDTIQPAETYERGPKDTFMVHPGQVVYIQGFFDLTGRYVYHCHMLEHEDQHMMHQLEVKPTECSCILNPLLRESEIVPAPNLPFPFGLDDASVLERELQGSRRLNDAQRRAQAASVYEEWRADLIARNPIGNVSSCAPPACDPPPELDASRLFPCAAPVGGAAATATPTDTCPVLPNNNFLVLRAELISNAPLVCGLDPTIDPACQTELVAQININDLHAAVCPDAPNCRPTDERTEQSEERDPLRRTQLAILEDNRFQAVELALADAEARRILSQYPRNLNAPGSGTGGSSLAPGGPNANPSGTSEGVYAPSHTHHPNADMHSPTGHKPPHNMP